MSALKAWLHRRRQPLRYQLLDGLLVTQALTPEQLRRKQQEDLRAMVDFARVNTVYYGERIAQLPKDWQIGDLPILTKADVITRLRDLLTRGHNPDTTPIGHTGGSTGKPLAFYYNEAKHELMRAGMMRSYMLSGWRPGQKILNFWGARQDTVAGGVFGGERIGDFIAAEKTLPAHEVSEDKLNEWASFIQRYRPALLQGYASILAALARFVIDRGLRMPTSLIGVYSTAEMLDDTQRAAMEEAFGCKVFNQYGSREIPNIACECRHGRMHVFTDMVWLESIDGNLLVTSLTNRLMPMIRYENGDSGELLDEPCNCGLPFPLMAMGLCRKNDFIVAPDGRQIHPSFFNRLLYGQTQVTQYQFVQETAQHVVLRLATELPLADTAIRAMKSSVADTGLALEVAYVPEIERTISGKHRFVIRQI
ncbi:phenylacetate--CoA ligase family protein [Rhodocyclaceae bacterium]